MQNLVKLILLTFVTLTLINHADAQRNNLGKFNTPLNAAGRYTGELSLQQINGVPPCNAASEKFILNFSYRTGRHAKKGIVVCSPAWPTVIKARGVKSAHMGSIRKVSRNSSPDCRSDKYLPSNAIYKGITHIGKLLNADNNTTASLVFVSTDGNGVSGAQVTLTDSKYKVNEDGTVSRICFTRYIGNVKKVTKK